MFLTILPVLLTASPVDSGATVHQMTAASKQQSAGQWMLATKEIDSRLGARSGNPICRWQASLLRPAASADGETRTSGTTANTSHAVELISGTEVGRCENVLYRIKAQMQRYEAHETASAQRMSYR